MKYSEKLQLDVLDELAYDSAVDSSNIAVTASAEGVVTLQGSVQTFMQARAAERAAKRVRGVQAVAGQLEVNPLIAVAVDDTKIAETTLRALAWSASLPDGAVKVTVRNGWVTLEGQVDWEFQRTAAIHAVRDLRGVKGVVNQISIKPTQVGEIRHRIEDALRRHALIDAANLAVSVNAGRAVLRGVVSSLAEKEAAERAAYAAAGVIDVDNKIEVRAHAIA